MGSTLCKATIILGLSLCWASVSCEASKHYFYCKKGQELTGNHSPIIDSLHLMFTLSGRRKTPLSRCRDLSLALCSEGSAVHVLSALGERLWALSPHAVQSSQDPCLPVMFPSRGSEHQKDSR